MKEKALKSFQIIPGVGPSIANDLWNIGIRSLEDLKDNDPEQMYEAICEHQGCHVDRCILYVFRLAVYFASTEVYDSEKLKWWNWKD